MKKNAFGMTPGQLIERTSSLDPEMAKTILVLLLEQLADSLHTDDRGGQDFYLVDVDDLQRVVNKAKALSGQGPVEEEIPVEIPEGFDPIAEMFSLIGD